MLSLVGYVATNSSKNAVTNLFICLEFLFVLFRYLVYCGKHIYTVYSHIASTKSPKYDLT